MVQELFGIVFKTPSKKFEYVKDNSFEGIVNHYNPIESYQQGINEFTEVTEDIEVAYQYLKTNEEIMDSNDSLPQISERSEKSTIAQYMWHLAQDSKTNPSPHKPQNSGNLRKNHLLNNMISKTVST